jgi:glycerol-3-phosphate dehydrogenase (NAD(P)+)
MSAKTSRKPPKVAVIGGGAWGTALASVAARDNAPVLLWAREPEVAAQINSHHQNQMYLPDIPLPPTLSATNELGDVAAAEVILLVAPAQHLASIATDLSTVLESDKPVVICSKGIERDTHRLMSDALTEACPKAIPAVLSGPSFAADVARGLPTAVTLAVRDAELGARIMDEIGGPFFRPYLSDDLIGVQLGGAIKNVLAIACGIVEGKKLGDSARAALTSRGFAEMSRLAIALGAKRETLAGLSGLGDLILTCGSPQSRNMSLGIALGEGQKLDDALSKRVSVTEGVYTAAAVVELAAEKNVEMPIANAVNNVVTNSATVDDAIMELLSRPFTTESLSVPPSD